tara:strand:- start:886 stop:1191 length:306 start_codon:yes stop_codon:yes gene_type:complete
MNNDNTNSTASSNWMKREIGALWAKQSNSTRFWSGYIELDKLGIKQRVNLVLFKNKSKDNNANEPVLRVYLGKEHLVQEKEDQQVESNTVADNQVDSDLPF